MGRIRIPDSVDPYRSDPGALEAWDRYVGYEKTLAGTYLTAFRANFVFDHAGGKMELVDVGIGSGAFLREWNMVHGHGRGLDVNPHGVAWLEEQGWKAGPPPYDAVTLWDVLEHLKDPAAFVAQVRQWVFCTVPVCETLDEWLSSHHLRPTEHRWYWTPDGLIRWFSRQGFELVARSKEEVEICRSQVETFAFRRKA